MAGTQDDERVDSSGTETVDLGSTRRPWAAYVLVAILVLAAAGVGLHRLIAGGSLQRSAVFISVVGDLPRAQLARVARATTASQARGLVVAGVPGLTRTASAGYGQSSTFEAEYSASKLGLGSSLGAKIVNVSVLTGSGVEQGIFWHPAPEVLSRIRVHGQPGVLLQYGRSGLLVGWAVPPSAEVIIVCNHCAKTAQVEQALIRVARTSELYALALPPPDRH